MLRYIILAVKPPVQIASIALSLLLSGVARLVLRAEMKDLRARVAVLIATHPIDSVSPLALQALILAEDRRFYRHRGIDLWAVGRALYRILAAGKLEGASTIEQQLVRTLTDRYDCTLARKLREMMAACTLPSVVSKSETACLYLSVAYFGAGMKGYREACRRLASSDEAPTVAEAAAIVARLKYPEPVRKTPTISARLQRRTRHIECLLSYAVERRGVGEGPSYEAVPGATQSRGTAAAVPRGRELPSGVG